MNQFLKMSEVYHCKISFGSNLCDATSCIVKVSAVLSHTKNDGGNELCRKFEDFSKCVDKCFHEIFPYFIPEADYSLNVWQRVCDDDLIFSLNDNWECIAKNAYALVTCLAVTQSMEAVNLNSSDNLMLCKKAISAENCPQEILFEKCGENAAESMGDLLQLILKPQIKSACEGVSIGILADVPVNNHLGDKYIKIATCIDSQQIASEKCFAKFLRNESSIKDYFCNNDNNLSRCILAASDDCLELLSNINFFKNVFSLGNKKCNNYEEYDRNKDYRVVLSKSNFSKTTPDERSFFNTKANVNISMYTESNKSILPSGYFPNYTANNLFKKWSVGNKPFTTSKSVKVAVAHSLVEDFNATLSMEEDSSSFEVLSSYEGGTNNSLLDVNRRKVPTTHESEVLSESSELFFHLKPIMSNDSFPTLPTEQIVSSYNLVSSSCSQNVQCSYFYLFTLLITVTLCDIYEFSRYFENIFSYC